jgi:hypothetical protein
VQLSQIASSANAPRETTIIQQHPDSLISNYGRSGLLADFCAALTGCGQHRQCSDLKSRLFGVNQFTPIIHATTLV